MRALFVGVASALWLSGGAAWAIHPSNNPTAVGEIGPLIPFHKDAIHAGLAATGDGDLKICFFMRPSEYAGHHLVDQTLVEQLFDQSLSLTGAMKPEFENLVFEEDGDVLQVTAPAGPALAIPGDYLLFVVSDQGVPGEAKVVHVDGA